MTDTSGLSDKTETKTGFADMAGYYINQLIGKVQEGFIAVVSPGELSGQPSAASSAASASQAHDLVDSFNALSVSSPGTNAPSTSPDGDLANPLNVLSVSSPAPSQRVPLQSSNPDSAGGFNVIGALSSQPSRRSCSPTPKYAHPELDDFDNVSIPSPPTTPTKPQRPQVHGTLSAPGVSTLSSVSPPVTPARPSSTSTRPQASSPVTPPGNSSSLSPPVTPAKSRSSRASTTPSGKTVQKQCAGFTKAGKQCTRRVRVEFIFKSDGDEDEDDVPRFCYWHTAELLTPSGYHSKKNGEWVKFDDWILPYLQPSTQASLRAEMVKAKSSSDKFGYIYTFEIREPDVEKTIKLKVGRAVNPIKRIDQWSKQCSSKEQVLLGFYPPSNAGEDQGSYMRGLYQLGEKTAWYCRLERLVHIELADLASTCVYLEPGWPNIKVPASSTTNMPTKSKPVNGNGNGNGSQLCPDCGSMHREIFEFRRWEEGRMKGKEWECIVKPVVERWGRFVNAHV